MSVERGSLLEVDTLADLCNWEAVGRHCLYEYLLSDGRKMLLYLGISSMLRLLLVQETVLSWFHLQAGLMSSEPAGFGKPDGLQIKGRANLRLLERLALVALW